VKAMLEAAMTAILFPELDLGRSPTLRVRGCKITARKRCEKMRNLGFIFDPVDFKALWFRNETPL